MGRRKRADADWPVCTRCQTRPAATDGRCSTCDSRSRRGAPTDTALSQVGHPSGYGRYGVVERTEYGVLCHECGDRPGTLGGYHLKRHGLTAAQYRDRHGLAAGDPLASESALKKLRAASLARVGGEQWQRFEAGRDAALPVSQPAAAAATRNLRAGARAIRERSAAAISATVEVASRPCRICGGPVPAAPVGRRSRRVLCDDPQCRAEAHRR